MDKKFKGTDRHTAFPAGPFAGASKTRTPVTPSCSTDWSGANLIPKIGRVTFPNCTNWSTIPPTWKYDKRPGEEKNQTII